jgi:hypothetical protein
MKAVFLLELIRLQLNAMFLFELMRLQPFVEVVFYAYHFCGEGRSSSAHIIFVLMRMKTRSHFA